MNKLILKSSVAAAAVLAVAQVSHAIPITGSFGIAGSAEFDTGSVNTATKVTQWVDTTVKSDTGVLAAYIPATSSISIANPWSFNTASPIASFWSLDGFTFQLNQSSIQIQQLGLLYVTGTGVISGNGYDATDYSWSFSAQDPAAGDDAGTPTWTFSASQGTVPDGSTTVLLLGTVLSGIALIKRKLVA